MKICTKREAFLFGQQQITLVPERFHQAFLSGARDKACVYAEESQGIIDPEVEAAYKKLLLSYKNKAAIAKAIGIESSNLYKYVAGRAPIGPRIKKKFLAAAAALPAED